MCWLLAFYPKKNLRIHFKNTKKWSCIKNTHHLTWLSYLDYKARWKFTKPPPCCKSCLIVLRQKSQSRTAFLKYIDELVLLYLQSVKLSTHWETLNVLVGVYLEWFSRLKRSTCTQENIALEIKASQRDNILKKKILK